MASDPYFYGGGWTADAAQKVARFVDLAKTFHLPVVHLVDVPGFVIGKEAEKAGTIRHGARALAAIYQAKVPWCSVIIRKVFGVAGAGTPAHAAALPLRLAVGRLGLAAGRGRHRGGLQGRARRRARSRSAARRDRGAAQPVALAVPHRRDFLVEEIIDPRDTRPLLCEFAESGREAARAGPGRDADAAVKVDKFGCHARRSGNIHVLSLSLIAIKYFRDCGLFGRLTMHTC